MAMSVDVIKLANAHSTRIADSVDFIRSSLQNPQRVNRLLKEIETATRELKQLVVNASTAAKRTTNQYNVVVTSKARLESQLIRLQAAFDEVTLAGQVPPGTANAEATANGEQVIGAGKLNPVGTPKANANELTSSQAVDSSCPQTPPVAQSTPTTSGCFKTPVKKPVLHKGFSFSSPVGGKPTPPWLTPAVDSCSQSSQVVVEPTLSLSLKRKASSLSQDDMFDNVSDDDEMEESMSQFEIPDSDPPKSTDSELDSVVVAHSPVVNETLPKSPVVSNSAPDSGVSTVTSSQALELLTSTGDESVVSDAT